VNLTGEGKRTRVDTHGIRRGERFSCSRRHGRKGKESKFSIFGEEGRGKRATTQ